MKDAEFIEYEVDIHFQCPTCNKYFRLRNYDIPQDTPSYHNCVECSEGLVIKPFTIIVSQEEPKKEKTKKTSKPDPSSTDDPIKKRAISMMKAYGFKQAESKLAVEKVHYAGIELEELIKKALSEFGK